MRRGELLDCKAGRRLERDRGGLNELGFGVYDLFGDDRKLDYFTKGLQEADLGKSCLPLRLSTTRFLRSCRSRPILSVIVQSVILAGLGRGLGSHGR